MSKKRLLISLQSQWRHAEAKQLETELLAGFHYSNLIWDADCTGPTAELYNPELNRQRLFRGPVPERGWKGHGQSFLFLPEMSCYNVR